MPAATRSSGWRWSAGSQARACLLALAAMLSLGETVLAQGAGALPLAGQPTDRSHGDRDWPCVQRKVPMLSPGSVWNGPPLDAAAAEWRSDTETAALVGRLAQRRLAVEEGTGLIREFMAAGGGDRALRGARLFAGLFDVISAERSRIMDGIERYARRQRILADAIRAEQSALDALRASAKPGDAAVADKAAALESSIRIFDERRRSLAFVCEVPVLLEQRLFAFGREIGAGLP